MKLVPNKCIKYVTFRSRWTIPKEWRYAIAILGIEWVILSAMGISHLDPVHYLLEEPSSLLFGNRAMLYDIPEKLPTSVLRAGALVRKVKQ